MGYRPRRLLSKRVISRAASLASELTSGTDALAPSGRSSGCLKAVVCKIGKRYQWPVGAQTHIGSISLRRNQTLRRMLSVIMHRSPESGVRDVSLMRLTCRGITFVLVAIGAACAQTPGTVPDPAQQVAAPPVSITLEEALHRAQVNEPSYASALADSRSAALDRSIARAALLPSLTYHNQALYTQPNGLQNQAGQGTGSQPSPRFIANNAVREYASQGVVDETVGIGQVAELRRAERRRCTRRRRTRDCPPRLGRDRDRPLLRVHCRRSQTRRCPARARRGRRFPRL